MPDCKDSLEQWARQAPWVQQAARGLSGHLVLLALAAQTAWLDLWVLPVLRAGEAWRARKASEARLVRRGIPDPLARQGLRVLQGRQGRRAMLGKPEAWVQLDPKATRASPELRERLAQQVRQALAAQPGQLVLLDHRVRQVRLATKA